MGDYNMAAKKKNATRRASDKPSKRKEFLELLEKARGEVTTLLKREKAGTLTERELQTGLVELRQDVRRMLAFKKAPL
jgi:hypothetical protein